MAQNPLEQNLLDLFYDQAKVWRKKNIDLFGITPVADTENIFLIKESLNSDTENYWIFGNCTLKDTLLNTNVLRSKQNLIKDSWKLEYNAKTRLVGLSACFLFSNSKKDEQQVVDLVADINEKSVEDRIGISDGDVFLIDEVPYEVQRKLLCFLPLVSTNGYVIRNNICSLRIQAARNTYRIRKKNGIVKYKEWTYDGGKFTFNDEETDDVEKIFDTINPLNYPILCAAAKVEKLEPSNLKKALDNLPECNRNSVLYFDFFWFDEIEKIFKSKSTSSINPKAGKTINYVNKMNAPRKYSNNKLKDLTTNLIISKDKISSLSTSRTVLFPPADGYRAPFAFSDTHSIFDSFKVTTNSLAGRARTMLDGFYIEDGMMKIDYNGKTYNHFDIVLGNAPAKLLNRSQLSAFSRAKYNYLNDAKRIMLCSKLRSQAVQVKDQLDDLSHEIEARVVFADFMGFSFGDSYIISQSFAKRLERTVHASFVLPKSELINYSVGDTVTQEDLVRWKHKNNFSSWQDIEITTIMADTMIVKARVPVGVGDKITNFHGSKGVISLILPDNCMPILKNDLSKNMPAGPVDVIVPGVSVFRRKSSGQVFEAVTSALNIPEMPVADLYKKHGDKIKEFDKKSNFDMMGQKFSAPCGLNNFIRLDHDATSKQSFSYVRTNTNFNLRVGEMELLNLASRGYYKILNELDVRSLEKHMDSFGKTKKLQETGRLRESECSQNEFKNYMKMLGWKISTESPLTAEEIDSRWEDFVSIVSDEEVDLFDIELDL